MKVKIGPYKNWFGPYQLAEKILFWKDDHDEAVIKLGERLDNTWLRPLLSWIDSKRERTIKVRIDDYDVWNIDSTLAYIVLPMLKKLQEQKHGSPWVDDEDVPEELRSTNAPPVNHEFEWDDNVHKRWYYVLGEMIFAFEMKNTDWTYEFYSGESDFEFVKAGETIFNPITNKEEETSVVKRGPKDTFKCDYEGMSKVEERIANGFRLFGKYYQGLWT